MINDGTDWLPAGWLYDKVLREIGATLGGKHPELSRILDAGGIDKSGCCDLRPLRGETFREFVAAADRACAAAESMGSKAVADEKFSQGYLEHFRRLCALLRSDPRSKA